MSNKRMTFPTMPGDTPRERFINLARHLLSTPKSLLADAPGCRRRKKTQKNKAKHIGLFLLCLLLSAIRPARADSAFVVRPKGWMMLIPPLGTPDPVTGEQDILSSAPEKKWSGVVIRGQDGKNYDFVSEDTCTGAAMMIRDKFRADGDRGRMYLFINAKCVRDDGRRHVIAEPY
jgi:hypothetical protein